MQKTGFFLVINGEKVFFNSYEEAAAHPTCKNGVVGLRLGKKVA